MVTTSSKCLLALRLKHWPSISIVVSGEWVNFPFLVNYPFKHSFRCNVKSLTHNTTHNNAHARVSGKPISEPSFSSIKTCASSTVTCREVFCEKSPSLIFFKVNDLENNCLSNASRHGFIWSRVPGHLMHLFLLWPPTNSREKLNLSV